MESVTDKLHFYKAAMGKIGDNVGQELNGSYSRKSAYFKKPEDPKIELFKFAERPKDVYDKLSD